MKKSVVQKDASITTTTLKNRKLTTMKKTILALLATTALTCVALNTAHADDIAFSGVATANQDSSVAGGATVTFSNPWTVIGSTGIFAGTNGQSATMSTVSFT